MKVLSFLLFALLLAPLAQANLTPAQSEAIVTALSDQPYENFTDFLVDVEQLALPLDEDSAVALQHFLADEALSEAENNSLWRLLGLYTRVRYTETSLLMLQELVAIPTHQVEGLPQHENPTFQTMADTLEAIAGDFGLAFRNVDNRIYEVTLPATASSSGSDTLVGFHSHADVVPANPELWVLEDGTQLDPFTVTLIGNRMYGRGTQDDKNGIVASLLAMKVIQDEGLPLQRNVRLLVDTTEETQGTAIPYYFERNPTPDYNIALDGSYPVVIAEKGYGTVSATFPVRPASGEGGELISLSGGLATNQIPSLSRVLIDTHDPAALAQTLQQAGDDYVAFHGDNFSITADVSADEEVTLTVNGISAHSSDPASGINPVSRMLDFIVSVQREQQLFRENHVLDAAHYAADNWGLDYLGNQLGIAYADDFMGPLTTSITQVALDEESLRLVVNLRMPVGREPDGLQQEIADKLSAWQEENGISMALAFSMGEPMYRNPEGLWVNALLDIATENLGLPREFGSSSGGTSIHDLPNGVQFGLAMPNEKYTGHNANEFKTVDQFLLDLQIVTETMARLGSMESL